MYVISRLMALKRMGIVDNYEVSVIIETKSILIEKLNSLYLEHT